MGKKLFDFISSPKIIGTIIGLIIAGVGTLGHAVFDTIYEKQNAHGIAIKELSMRVAHIEKGENKADVLQNEQLAQVNKELQRLKNEHDLNAYQIHENQTQFSKRIDAFGTEIKANDREKETRKDAAARYTQLQDSIRSLRYEMLYLYGNLPLLRNESK